MNICYKCKKEYNSFNMLKINGELMCKSCYKIKHKRKLNKFIG